VPLNYPPAHHDGPDDDPFRWMENPDDPLVQAWIKAENELTESVLATSPVRKEIEARLTELWDFPKFGVPFERGGRWFQTRNPGLLNQPVLYVADTPAGEGRVLLDPNLLSADGTIALTSLDVSDDGDLLAYATSVGGSDWRTWRIRDVTTGQDLDDLIEWSKFSAAAWRKDGSGFFYGAEEAPPPGSELTRENRALKIAFHRVGTPQADDVVIYEPTGQPDWLPEAHVTHDDRYLVVSISRGTSSEQRVEVLDLADPGASFVALVPDFSAKAMVVANAGSTFYVVTDRDAERGRIVAIDLADADADWRQVVPERPETLLGVAFCGGRLVCHYLQDAHSVLRVHDLDGTFVRVIPLPGIVSVAGLEGRPSRPLLHFDVMSFSESGALWAHDVTTGATTLVRPSTASIDTGELVTEQVFVPSLDGTRVPVFLTRRRDVMPSGEVPVLLYGYGGFDIPLTPSFSVTFAAWVERGGLLAVANLRGGGEYGKAWHEAGRLAHKQNVFDDFCSCARWLASPGSGWSRSDRIAISGGSNGGLLVGASLTQHPELFGAAVADVGVFDMLRFHLFTIGWAWKSDYGDPDDPEQRDWLEAYSPLHNVRPGTCYPPTMLMTGDHDDRVVPAHSFKFAATLQAAQACDHPALLRVETSAGHGPGKPTAKLISEAADRLAFLEMTVGRPDFSS
jgi:prolyl oligopeptidase